MKPLRHSREIELKKISEEMAQLKRDHDIAPDPHIKQLILTKWNNKAKEFANIIDNGIERKK